MSASNKLQISVDFKWISLLLLVVVIAMLAIWRPWQQTTSDRTVTVSGEATIKAEPDRFVFSPQYAFKNASKEAGIAQVSTKSEEVISGLKAVGVADKDIENQSSNYDFSYYPDNKEEQTYYLYLVVTVDSKEMAQKVQDYLFTTTPSGQITPQTSFSEQKRKELEDKAREDATADARQKADKSAITLGYKIGKVKSVEDGQNFGGGFYAMDAAVSAEALASPRMSVQPGQDELQYTVKVVYYVH